MWCSGCRRSRSCATIRQSRPEATLRLLPRQQPSACQASSARATSPIVCSGSGTRWPVRGNGFR